MEKTSNEPYPYTPGQCSLSPASGDRGISNDRTPDVTAGDGENTSQLHNYGAPNVNILSQQNNMRVCYLRACAAATSARIQYFAPDYFRRSNSLAQDGWEFLFPARTKNG